MISSDSVSILNLDQFFTSDPGEYAMMESLSTISTVWITVGVAILIVATIATFGFLSAGIKRRRAMRCIGSSPEMDWPVIAILLNNKVQELARRGQWFILNASTQTEEDIQSLYATKHKIADFAAMFEWEQNRIILRMPLPVVNGVDYADLPKVTMRDYALQKEWEAFQAEWKELIRLYPSLESESKYLKWREPPPLGDRYGS